MSRTPHIAAVFALGLLASACGVRGDPVPPAGRDTLIGPSQEFPTPQADPGVYVPAPAPQVEAEPEPDTDDETSDTERPRFPPPVAVE